VSEAWRPARSEPPPAAPIAAAVQPPAQAAAGASPPAPGGDGALDVRTEDRAGSYYALISAVTEPAGATLLIDEVEFGLTPLELDVPPGVYQMRLRMSGFRDLETEVQVDPATAVRVTGRLRPQ
jgi:hypothetical protein